ncbi:MAG: hypothetical protein WCO60_19580 [Verrucomicrobiota bacterium]
MTEEKLKQLLQQRASPKAPEGYYESLLSNLHRRQREDLLRRSLWQLAVDRISTFWGEHSFSGPKYAFAVASVTLVGMASILSVKPAATAESPVLATKTLPAAKIDILPAAAFQADDSGNVQSGQKRRTPHQDSPPQLEPQR